MAENAHRILDRHSERPHPFEGVMAAWYRFHQAAPAPAPAPRPVSRVRRRLRFRVLLYFVLGLAALDLLVAANRATWRTYDPDCYLERLEGCRAGPRDLVVVG